MNGILADINVRGHVDFLLALVQSPPWRDIWGELRLSYATFASFGLDPAATDVEIWHRCQDEGYVLITDNRNSKGKDSLDSVIRSANTLHSLPVLTIGNIQRLRHNREYAESVVVRLFEILIDIESVRGAGRLYLP